MMSDTTYVFRGDDGYSGGPIGLTIGEQADAADIQTLADHVLRKESTKSSRYSSFTTVFKIARKFTSRCDNKNVIKVALKTLRELEAEGTVRVWDPDQVFAALKQQSVKLARQAGDVRAAMRRNREILVEGQIPSSSVERTN
jgi:hypothetical protein